MFQNSDPEPPFSLFRPYFKEKPPDVNSGLKTESGAEKRHLWG